MREYQWLNSSPSVPCTCTVGSLNILRKQSRFLRC